MKPRMRGLSLIRSCLIIAPDLLKIETTFRNGEITNNNVLLLPGVTKASAVIVIYIGHAPWTQIPFWLFRFTTYYIIIILIPEYALYYAGC